MADIDKTMGGRASASGGMRRDQVDPDRWLETLVRTIGGYVRSQVSPVYDVRITFPDSEEVADFPKLKKTIIHFEIEDIGNPVFGMGDNFVDAVYDDSNVLVTGIEARKHEVAFDVGIWASSDTGGPTARMRAYQELTKCFVGSVAYNKALNNHDFEIRRFDGGIFVKEDISDIPIFRVVGVELGVCVYSRVLDEARTYVDEIVQDPNLETVDEEVISG